MYRMYKVRIASDPSREDSPMISTSIPARCLVSAGMQDHLQVIDINTSHPFPSVGPSHQMILLLCLAAK